MHPLSPTAPQLPGDRRRWTQLHGSSAALAIARSAQSHSYPTLVITATGSEAQRLEAELSFFKRDDMPLLRFPDWETLPYDFFSPHQDIISERLSTLYRLPTTQRGLVVVPITTLLHRLAPPAFLRQHSLVVKPEQTFDPNAMARQFEAAGYRSVKTVFEHGEFALRGSLVDIYPMGSELPYRIDLFDDEVASLRTFDPESQRTVDKIDEISLLPAKEFPLDEAGISHFRDSWHQRFDVDHRRCSVYQDISDGIAPAGIEYFLPLFFEQCATLFDYLPEQTLIFTQGDIQHAVEHFWEDIRQRYESHSGNIERPILPPEDIFLRTEQLFHSLKQYPRVDLDTGDAELEKKAQAFASSAAPVVYVDSKAKHPLGALETFLLATNNRVLFVAESLGRRQALLELLQRIRVKPDPYDSWQDFLEGDSSIAITVDEIACGMQLEEPGISLITESELFGQRVQQKRRRQAQIDNNDNVVKNLTELHIGAPVVHIDHGVGRYGGLETIAVDGETHEFLLLHYASNDKLYVPVASLDLISRYSGADEDHAPLHKLGSEVWQKAKRKAVEKVRDVAAELLDIYARRAAKPGFTFADPEEAYKNFAESFPFEETPDQTAAINAVRDDMLSARAMDRLVCGDVGFGKTEVAMRAAFIAVNNSKQVAILVPTTLLAQQHYENFKDRFADWPVNIEVLSRFRSSGETTEVEKRLADGSVDIVVGTHKLLQSDVKYKDLGLLIIDEEHRFGVRQKDALKALRADVDILTLTATPIPRTLNMAMSGIRDLSIISTPPAKRLSVRTFVRERETGLIKEAISREILRGGQVYFLHNEVKTIEKTAAEVQALIPEARVAIGHGQLREKELEQVMSDFYHKRFNVLVCSTIIETGIDVPNANTIIMDRADKLGLAQMHQLRGRVGRSHHQAYAYLLTPPKKQLTGDAVKRLDAISSAVDLGAGFTLATHDMEIRGAGELLGDEQSGQIEAVGFSLYMDLLDRAVTALKAGKEPNLDVDLNNGVDINLRAPALIPDTYLGDVHTRLILYKRIASATSVEALRELQVEMIDRFGLLPEPVQNLFAISELKLQATVLGIEKIEAGSERGRLDFSNDTQIDPLALVKLVQTRPQSYQLAGANQLKFTADMATIEDRLITVQALLNKLSQKEQAA